MDNVKLSFDQKLSDCKLFYEVCCQYCKINKVTMPVFGDGTIPKCGECHKNLNKPMEEKQEEIRHFESGAVRGSGGKLEFGEYLSPHMLFRYAEHMRKNAIKYGKGNWLKGIPENEYWESGFRHFMMIFMERQLGIQMEPDTDHYAALIFNIQGLMHEEAERKIKSGETKELHGYKFIKSQKDSKSL